MLTSQGPHSTSAAEPLMRQWSTVHAVSPAFMFTVRVICTPVSRHTRLVMRSLATSGPDCSIASSYAPLSRSRKGSPSVQRLSGASHVLSPPQTGKPICRQVLDCSDIDHLPFELRLRE